MPAVDCACEGQPGVCAQEGRHPIGMATLGRAGRVLTGMTREQRGHRAGVRPLLSQGLLAAWPPT